MSGWEYRDEYLDFSQLTIRQSNQLVPLSSIKFSYFNISDKDTKERQQQKAWSMIRPIIFDSVNSLGRQGRELVSPLDPSIIEIANGEYIPGGLYTLVGVFIGITIIGLPLVFLLLYTVPNDYFIYKGARLSFRRAIP